MVTMSGLDLHFLEAINKFYSGLLCDLWFDMFPNGSRPEQREVLSLLLAQIIGPDSSQKHRQSFISTCLPLLFGSFSH